MREDLNAGENEDEVMDMARRLCRLYRDTKDKELEECIEDDHADIHVEVAKRLKDVQERQKDIDELLKKATRAQSGARPRTTSYPDLNDTSTTRRVKTGRPAGRSTEGRVNRTTSTSRYKSA